MLLLVYIHVQIAHVHVVYDAAVYRQVNLIDHFAFNARFSFGSRPLRMRRIR